MILLFIIVGFFLLISHMVIKNKTIPTNIRHHTGRLSPMPKKPNAVSSQTDIEDKRVDPIPFTGSLEESKLSIKNALNKYGNTVIVTEYENYIHAVNTTEKAKFNDDLEFLFDNENRIIDFRSASRVGYSDNGLNRKRYNKLIELIK